MLKKLTFLFLLLPCFCFSALFFDGYLSKEKISELTLALQQFEQNPENELVLVISSQSGELVPMMELMKELYAFRLQKKAKIVACIKDEALGPSAIIPFIADELYATSSATWGAIVSRKETDIPLNVLRSRVQGFIDPVNPKFQTLMLLASAMIDPEVTIVDQNGWRQAFQPQEGQELVTKIGETLVVNRNQLEKLGLLQKGMPYLLEPAPIEKQLEPEVVSSFEEKLKKHIRLPEDGKGKIGYISIADRSEAISQATWIYVNTALNFYKKNPPVCIVLELNTPGGEVFAAEEISDALKEMDTQFGIPVIAYINNWAISAGAMLAYSSRFIVVEKDASMGAAEPIIMGQEGKPETASEKINSALRTDFANRAKYFDRNPFIAEAMVDKDVILVRRHGEIIKLAAEDEMRKGGIDPDELIKPKGKLLTLNADQMIEFQVADYKLESTKRAAYTQNEIETGILPIEKSALGQIAYFKNCQIESYHPNWQTRFLAFLASPAVSSLLFMIMLISIYMEISSGGFGVAGAVGLIALFLVLLSSFALEAMSWLEPILLLFGLILIALELFFFPTLGILGVVGAIFMLIGLGGMMLPGLGKISFEGDTVNAAGEYALTRLAWLSAALLASIVVIAILSRFMWPKFRLVQRLVLTDDQRSQEGLVGHVEPSALTQLPEVGVKAIVTSALRPAGKIAVGDMEYDAISTGGFVPEGKEVRVMHIEGHKVVVEEHLGV